MGLKQEECVANVSYFAQCGAVVMWVFKKKSGRPADRRGNHSFISIDSTTALLHKTQREIDKWWQRFLPSTFSFGMVPHSRRRAPSSDPPWDPRSRRSNIRPTIRRPSRAQRTPDPWPGPSPKKRTSQKDVFHENRGTRNAQNTFG